MATIACDMTKIGPSQTLYTPPRPNANELIILCTWLGAGRKPISKYVALYQALAPDTRILLIESSVATITATYPKQRRAIKPAVEVVLDTLSECGLTLHHQLAVLEVDEQEAREKVEPKILLHTFSTGGPISATQLLIVLHETLEAALPLKGMILDSGPAKGEYWKSYNASVLSLPRRNLLEQVIGVLISHGFLLILFASVAMGRYEQPEVLVRRTFLDEDIVSGEKNVCCIYSKADEFMDWNDVVEYAEEARAKKWKVEEMEFEGTAHCAHMVGDTEKYTDAIKRMWE